jgi:hypothetical protein
MRHSDSRVAMVTPDTHAAAVTWTYLKQTTQQLYYVSIAKHYISRQRQVTEGGPPPWRLHVFIRMKLLQNGESKLLPLLLLNLSCGLVSSAFLFFCIPLSHVLASGLFPRLLQWAPFTFLLTQYVHKITDCGGNICNLQILTISDGPNRVHISLPHT